MVLWKFTLREIKSRPGRATLTLLSIVISVAAVVAVTISTNTTHQAYKDMYESVAGRAAFEIVADQDRFFDTRIVKTLEKVSGVKTVIPLIQKWPTRLTFDKQRPLVMIMGMDTVRNELSHDYELKQGRIFTVNDNAEDVAMMESGFADALGIRVGDEIKLTHDVFRNGIVDSFKVVGLLSPRGTSNFNQMRHDFPAHRRGSILLFQNWGRHQPREHHPETRHR